jgi:hypothetical protein
MLFGGSYMSLCALRLASNCNGNVEYAYRTVSTENGPLVEKVERKMRMRDDWRVAQGPAGGSAESAITSRKRRLGLAR